MITTYKILNRKLDWIRFVVGFPKSQFIKVHAKIPIDFGKVQLRRESKILYVVITKGENFPNNKDG